MTQINLGRIVVVPKGTWTAGTYKALDLVRYNGASYIAKSTTTTTPTNATYWDLVSQDGANGSTGSTGATGAKGDTGDAGLSAYEVALANGFIGTEAEWLDSLHATSAGSVNSVNGQTGVVVLTANDLNAASIGQATALSIALG